MTTLEKKKYRLEEIAFFQEGPGLRNWQWTPDGMKVINGTNILLSGQVDTSNTDKFISLLEFESRYKHFAINDGDLVLTSSGTLGKVGRIRSENLPLMMNTSVIRFRSKNPKILLDDYLHCYLRSPEFQAKIRSFAVGGAQQNFGPSHLKQISLSLPTLRVQAAIAETVTSYDDLIENNRRRIALLEQSARLLYREWFVHLRFPGHEHVKLVDGVPEGWRKERLTDLAEITMGQSPTSDHYNKDRVGFPFHQGVTGFGERFVEHETWCDIRGRMAMPMDILFSVRAPVGRLNITPDEIVIGRGLSALRSKHDLQSMLFYQLANHFFKEDMIGGGAIFASVTKKELEGQLMLMPSLNLAREFNEFALSIDRQIGVLVEQNRKLREARDLLLPRLMSGDLVV